MKSLLSLSIVLSLVIGACTAPPATYAPQQLSAKELNEINFNTFFGDGPSSIAADYTLTVSAKSLPLEDVIGTTEIDISAVIPFAIGQDGFEITVRSSDFSVEGLPFEIPIFKARITASNASGLYLRGSGADLGTQRAFINADVYKKIKDILLPMMMMYSDPAALAEKTLANADTLSAEHLANLFSLAVYEKLTLELDHTVGNRFFYTSDFAGQIYPVIKQVLAQIDKEELLEQANRENQELGKFLAIFLSLSDEQLAPIIPALANCFNVDLLYELALNNYNELIFVSYAIDFSLPPQDEFLANLDHLISLIPAEFELPLPSAQQLLAMAENDAQTIDLDALFSMSASMYVGFKNLDLNDIALGHFDFEKSESAIDYSGLVEPQLPMFEQLLNNQMQNSAFVDEDAVESELF